MIIYKNRNLVIPVGLGPNFNNETVEIKNENKAVTITENGTEIITYNPAVYTGLGIVQINTEVQGGIIQDSVRLDITENGDYDVRPDENYDGLSEVSVTVNVQPELEAKTVDSSTASQVVTTDKYGLSSVTVNPYTLDEKTADSSTVVQVVTSDEDGLKQVTINPYVLSPLEVDSSTARQEITGQYGAVTVNPYTLDSSSAVITENGDYVFESSADGLSRVDVTVNLDTQSYYNEGYSNGKTAGIAEGIAEQKAKLDSSTFTSNGTYTREDGWNEITVDIDTVNNQSKTVDSSTNSQIVTFDPEYTGLSTVTVNPYELDSKTVDPSTNRQIITSSKDGLSSVTINPYVLDSKTVDPSTNQITVTSSADGLNSVTVNAVTSSIDNNITAGNIKNGVTILGVQGTYSGTTINNQNKTVDASTNQQSVTYDSGYTGLGIVTVNAYDIDSCYTLAASI